MPEHTPAPGATGAASPVATSRLDPAAVRRTVACLHAAAESPWLHQEAARRMAERLGFILKTPEVLLDWSLEASVSPALLAQYPQARALQVLPAGAKPAAAAGWRAGLRRWWRAGPEQLEAQELAAGSAELLWSNMALHREGDPPALFKAWRQALKPDGFVMFSSLGPGSLAQLRSVYREAGWPLPHAPFVDMHDLGDMLVEAGFADPVMDQEVLTLTYAEPERLLIELRQLGANLAPQRYAGCRTPRWRERLLGALRERAGPDGRIALDFELVYGHAFRAADRGPAVAERTTVDLDAMKLMLRNSKAVNKTSK